MEKGIRRQGRGRGRQKKCILGIFAVKKEKKLIDIGFRDGFSTDLEIMLWTVSPGQGHWILDERGDPRQST